MRSAPVVCLALAVLGAGTWLFFSRRDYGSGRTTTSAPSTVQGILLAEAMTLSETGAICIAEEVTLPDIRDQWMAQSAYGLHLDLASRVQLSPAEVETLCQLANKTTISTPRQEHPWGDEEVRYLALINIRKKCFLSLKIVGTGGAAIILANQVIPLSPDTARFGLGDETLFYREITNVELSNWLMERIAKR